MAAEKALTACAERDAALLQLEDLQGLENQPPANGQTDSKVTVMKSHLQKIAALEAEVKRLKKVRGQWQSSSLAVSVSQSSSHADCPSIYFSQLLTNSSFPAVCSAKEAISCKRVKARKQ